MIAAPVPFEEFSRKSCYEFKIGSEGEGAAAAARYRSTGDVARLLDIIERLDEVKRRLEPGIAEDFEFHMAVAQASRNDYFVSVLASLKDSITEGMLLARTATGLRIEEKLTAINEQHRLVYDAIRDGDDARARWAMREHLQRCAASTSHWNLFSAH